MIPEENETSGDATFTLTLNEGEEIPLHTGLVEVEIVFMVGEPLIVDMSSYGLSSFRVAWRETPPEIPFVVETLDGELAVRGQDILYIYSR